MKVKELLSVLDLEHTAIDWIDRTGSHTLTFSRMWISEEWNITKIFVDSDRFLVVHVDGDFERHEWGIED